MSERGFVVVILGAECTGKSSLAAALRDELLTQRRDAVVVCEHLRAFCDAHGRTPLASEQAGIAGEQTRQIAAASEAHAIVIADTSALMTAIYSEQLFADTRLLEGATTLQRPYGLTLLCAPDLSWSADGVQRDGPGTRVRVDAALRAHMIRSLLPFSVVQGQGQERLAAALAALRSALQAGDAAAALR